MVVDTFILYEFLRRLTTPFDQMPAFRMGLIDRDGKFLKKRDQYTQSEKDALTYFDVLIINLKKLIGKIPGGSSQIGTFAAALLLLKEHKNIREDNIENVIFELDDKLKMYMEDVATAMPDAPTNTTAGVEGLLAGGLKVSPAARSKYKKKNIQDTKKLMTLIRRRPAKLVGVEEETTLKYHDKLNKKIWNDDQKLDDQVRGKLLQIADAWADFANIPKDKISDIIITGGNVNYNYTDQSDIDLHLVIDRNSLNPNRTLVDDYLQDKKILWTLSHQDLHVKGYPVELYAQDMDETPHTGQGVYSIKNNQWIQAPQYLGLNFETDPHLQKKVQFYKDLIDKMISQNATQGSLDMIKQRIAKMRNDSIAQGGEFAFGNLVFKDLRNQGYLDKMNNYKKSLQDKALSLE